MRYTSFEGTLVSDVTTAYDEEGEYIHVALAFNQYLTPTHPPVVSYLTLEARYSTADYVRQQFCRGDHVRVAGTLMHTVYEDHNQRKLSCLLLVVVSIVKESVHRPRIAVQNIAV